MAAQEDVRTEQRDGVLEVTLNRPQKKNAITRAMYDALTEAFDAASTSSNVRAVLIRGEGDAFTAGNDLKDFLNSPPTGTDTPVFRFLNQLISFQKPLVAAAHGAAIGLGTTLLLHADLVYLSEDASLQLPFVNLGLVPEAASTYLMPRLMGHPRAAELLFFGEPFDALTALEVGLANRVLPANELLNFARERATTLTKKAPTAIKKTKALLRRGAHEAVRAALETEGQAFLERLKSPEAMEAFTAFLEKRSPEF